MFNYDNYKSKSVYDSGNSKVGWDSAVGIVTRYGPDRGEIFRARPDRPWCPPCLLCNGYQVVAGVKAAGARR